MKIIKAEIRDLSLILALQKCAYQSEAKLVGDYSIPPLTQTIEGIAEDFNKGVILKADDNEEIIGSVRVHKIENATYIGKLIVTPLRQNQGIGKALLLAAEKIYPNKRYELFTSDRSVKNISLYTKAGYCEFNRKPLNQNANIVFMEKYG